jgi:lipid-binding SYLF domain-containing protein
MPKLYNQRCNAVLLIFTDQKISNPKNINTMTLGINTSLIRGQVGATNAAFIPLIIPPKKN